MHPQQFNEIAAFAAVTQLLKRVEAGLTSKRPNRDAAARAEAWREIQNHAACQVNALTAPITTRKRTRKLPTVPATGQPITPDQTAVA